MIETDLRLNFRLWNSGLKKMSYFGNSKFAFELNMNGVIKFVNCAFVIQWEDDKQDFGELDNSQLDLTVIGNIHENHELIQGGFQ